MFGYRSLRGELKAQRRHVNREIGLRPIRVCRRELGAVQEGGDRFQRLKD